MVDSGRGDDLSISSGEEINAMTTKINGRSCVSPSCSVYLFTARLHEEQRPTRHLLLRGKVTFLQLWKVFRRQLSDILIMVAVVVVGGFIVNEQILFLLPHF